MIRNEILAVELDGARPVVLGYLHRLSGKFEAKAAGPNGRRRG